MDSDTKPETLRTMSLGDHLEELRYRLVMAIIGLVVGLVICLCLGQSLLGFLAKPYRNAMAAAGIEPQLQAIQLTEPFLVYFNTSLVFGLILSSPWIFYQLWKFVSAGLYSRERRMVYAAVPASAALFIAGAAFFIWVVAPTVITFFVKFNTGIEFVKTVPTLQSYINFVLSLALIFGLAFQMPIVIIFAERMGLISIETLIRARKFVILALLIIAAIATPGPDVISQTALAVPMYVLYEGSILICRLLRKRRGKKELRITMVS